MNMTLKDFGTVKDSTPFTNKFKSIKYNTLLSRHDVKLYRYMYSWFMAVNNKWLVYIEDYNGEEDTIKTFKTIKEVKDFILNYEYKTEDYYNEQELIKEINNENNRRN